MSDATHEMIREIDLRCLSCGHLIVVTFGGGKMSAVKCRECPAEHACSVRTYTRIESLAKARNATR